MLSLFILAGFTWPVMRERSKDLGDTRISENDQPLIFFFNQTIKEQS